MPELPEIEGLAAWVRHDLAGQSVRDVRLRSVAALKTYDPPISSLIGSTVTGATRRAKYLVIEFGDLLLVSHLSLGGWLRWVEGQPERKPSLRGPIIAEFRFDAGSLDFTEHGKEKRLSLWLVRSIEEVPQIRTLGPEATEMTEDSFAAGLRAQPGTLKSVLADQHVIAGIGNAYSDDILHAAKLSPFLKTTVMTDDQSLALYSAVQSVLADAVMRSSGLAAKSLKKDKKEHYAVHGRTGEQCPICGDTIRAVWPGARSFQYCPTCQTGGKIYKDRRLSRLLK